MKLNLLIGLLVSAPSVSALPIDVYRFLDTFRQSIFKQPDFVLSQEHTKTVSLISEQDYEQWIRSETDIAFESIIQNIGKYGKGLDDVMPGSVIASPSKFKPNYYYQWVRDAGITINSLVMAYSDQHAANATLRNIIQDYIASSKEIQRVSNPSGDFESLTGLGEPKFEVDGSAFTGNWGRPQRDGPALRSIAIINYINTEVKYNPSVSYADFESIFNDVIQNDLEYVTRFWKLKGFDLWEEVDGMHFFTSMSHHRSLVLGSELAHHLGYTNLAEKYKSEINHLEKFITFNFYDHNRGHLVETLDFSARSGLDSALFLGSIHAQDLFSNTYNQSNSLYEPYSDAVVSSLIQYIEDMRYRYPINLNRLQTFQEYGFNTSLVGFGVGRYPEDIYDGVGTSIGNPWFLCTATVSHTLYIIADYLYTRPSDFTLHVTDSTKLLYGMFVADFDWRSPDFNIHRTDSKYLDLVKGLMTYADSFLDVIREHHDGDGFMSEQFSRYDGYMRGAEKLTWSYGAFWSAVRQRHLVRSRFQNEN